MKQSQLCPPSFKLTPCSCTIFAAIKFSSHSSLKRLELRDKRNEMPLTTCFMQVTSHLLISICVYASDITKNGWVIIDIM